MHRPLDLVLAWHMHQPDYRDHATGEFTLPWVYLHAIKDYTDMAWHLEHRPGMRAVINLVPVGQLEAAKTLGRPLSRLRLITCHLGNGCSIAAVKYGKSIDTSMGFTPLEGLVMGTRCGDIDPASVIFIEKKEKASLEEIDRVLNNRSGLLGISGISNDMREIRKASARGHRRARLALDIFAYRVKKYIGSYVAALGGVDAIVFTAGIGENQDGIRRKVSDGLFDFLDRKKVRVLVIPTNEELMIARQTFELVR